jgi:hypothetical protein
MLTARRRPRNFISYRHEAFARVSVFEAIPGGDRRFLNIPPVFRAYLRTYGNARSEAGARASASRLMKRRDVQAARQWFHAVLCREVPQGEPMPRTLVGIYARLRQLGSPRADYACFALARAQTRALTNP